jgi:hypothetical protein
LAQHSETAITAAVAPFSASSMVELVLDSAADPQLDFNDMSYLSSTPLQLFNDL